MSRKNVLLHTDPGTDFDDAAAIYIFANSEVIDLRGVYTVHGPVLDRARIAQHLLDLCGHDAMVAVGESEPFLSSALFKPLTGTEEHMLPEDVDVDHKLEMDWMGKMLDQLQHYSDVIVASIAPMTNLAKLLKQKPGAAEKIKKLYIMGSRVGAPEYNFAQDPKAAQIVLDSGIDTVILPADVCNKYQAHFDFLTALDELGGSEAQEYLSYMASLWKLSHDVRIMFNNNLTKKFSHIEVEGLSLGDRITREDLKRYDMFVESLKIACNLRNFTDDPNEAFFRFRAVMNWSLDNPDFGYVKKFLRLYREMEKKSVQLSDTFIPYAIEHPERIKESRVTLSCDLKGCTVLQPGSRHRMVIDVDYKHFESYLKKRLKQKPKPRKAKRQASKLKV